MTTEPDFEDPFFTRAIAMLYHALDPERTLVSFMTIPMSNAGTFARWLFTADIGGTEDSEGEPFSAGYISVNRAGPEIILVTTFPMETTTVGVLDLE